MKRLGFLVGAIVLATGLAVAAHDFRQVAARWSSMGPLARGTTVPEFQIELLEGGQLTRDDLVGRVSVVTFWASWCGVCASEMPMYRDLARRHADEADVQFILVNREGSRVSPRQARPIVARTAREQDLDMPLAIDDGTLYAAMRARVLPHTVVVDPAGVIRHVHPGRVMRSTLESEIDSLRDR